MTQYGPDNLRAHLSVDKARRCYPPCPLQGFVLTAVLGYCKVDHHKMAAEAAPTGSSLVKYDVPILVSGSKPGAHGAAASQTQEILNSILPPRCV